MTDPIVPKRGDLYRSKKNHKVWRFGQAFRMPQVKGEPRDVVVMFPSTRLFRRGVTFKKQDFEEGFIRIEEKRQ
jgi:hypothetical protein